MKKQFFIMVVTVDMKTQTERLSGYLTDKVKSAIKDHV